MGEVDGRCRAPPVAAPVDLATFKRRLRSAMRQLAEVTPVAPVVPFQAAIG
jgi:hypothetical protein